MTKGFSINAKPPQHSEPLYRIEEEGTNGWFLVEDYEGLSKEQTNHLYHELIRDGHNPKRLRIVRIS